MLEQSLEFPVNSDKIVKIVLDAGYGFARRT